MLKYLPTLLIFIPLQFFQGCNVFTDTVNTTSSPIQPQRPTLPLVAPSQPWPEDGATPVASQCSTLEWTHADTSGRTIRFRCYFGTENPPPLFRTNLSAPAFTTSGKLSYGTTYFWRVTAEYQLGLDTISGPVWSFTPRCSLEVSFPDSAIDREVRRMAHIEEGILCISELTTVTYLSVTDSTMSDLTGLPLLSNCLSMNFFHNRITDLSPLSACGQLRNLTVSYNPLTSLLPLEPLANLVTLNAEYNKLTSTNGLEGCTGLQKLVLNRNTITDISALKHLTSLRYLDLSINGITNIIPLAVCTELRYLSLNHNAIENGAPLQNLVNLNTLRLDQNKLGNISFLSGCGANLTLLILRSNDISDLSPLAECPYLETLDIAYNPKITDLSPLLDNSGIGKGTAIDARGCDLDQHSLTVVIPELQDRGVTLQY